MSAYAHPTSTPIPVPPSQNQALPLPGLGIASFGIVSPPTPLPSPRPNQGHETFSRMFHKLELGEMPKDESAAHLLSLFTHLPPSSRLSFLHALPPLLSQPEALSLSRRIEPRLKRDFLRDLPLELALHALSYVSDAYTLTRAALVSRHWNRLLQDETTWRDMCARHDFLPIRTPLEGAAKGGRGKEGRGKGRWVTEVLGEAGGSGSRGGRRGAAGEEDEGDWSKTGVDADKGKETEGQETYRDTYRHRYIVEQNWLHGGTLLATHNSTTNVVVSSLAMTSEHIVVGTADASIHVFDAKDGSSLRSLEGHAGGVWALGIYEGASSGLAASSPGSQDAGRGGSEDVSDSCGSVPGWGNATPLVVSGGSDKRVSVYDLSTGARVHSLQGHTSTIRCLKLIPGEPTVITGSRDNTVRVWDVEKGVLVRTMQGHSHSVRCLDVSVSSSSTSGVEGKRRRVRQCLSGSYDYTARLWDFDTGECLHVLRGHYHQVYAVCLDSASASAGGRARAFTGSLDSTVRVWSTQTGECLQLLVGHTSLVGVLQIAGERLVSGGSDGRVIQFALPEGAEAGTGARDGTGAVEERWSDEEGGEADEGSGTGSGNGNRCQTIRRMPATLSSNAFPELSSAASTGTTGGFGSEPIGLAPGLSHLLPSNTAEAPDGSGSSSLFSSASTALVPSSSSSHSPTPTPAATTPPSAGYKTLHRLCAHDNSVTALEYTGRAGRFLVSGGNDGRVKLWDARAGAYVRDLTEGGESVWRVAVRGERCVLVLQREGKTVVEVWGFGEGDAGRGKGKGEGGKGRGGGAGKRGGS